MNKNVYKYDEMKRTEHMAVRKTVGWYFFTHQLLEVTGPDAAAFLDKLYTNHIANLKVGSERYTTMLNEKGEIIDDVVVFRMAEQTFWVSTLYLSYLVEHMENNQGDFDVEWNDLTKEYNMYAVQGPNSKALINALVKDNVDDQKFFTIRDNEIDGIPVKINRAGFTGEKFGYEIYVAPAQDETVIAKLKACGKELGAVQVTDFQIMAWTLPTEAGFYYMRDLIHTNPFEVGLERGIGWDKEFIGKDALLKIKETGPEREMVGFTMDEADVRVNGKDQGGPGSPVTVDGDEIGRVSKFNYSYVQETCVGYILAQRGAVKKGDHVTIAGKYDAVITEKHFI